MRRSLMAWVCVSLCACGGQADPRDSADTLVLELGGKNEPLGPALLRLHKAGEPAASLPIEAPVAALPTVGPVGIDPPEPPVVEPPPPPEFFSVSLHEGETVYGLARTHLGSASRWLEVLELNGWTEAQAAQLPVGTMVKLPIR